MRSVPDRMQQLPGKMTVRSRKIEKVVRAEELYGRKDR